MFSSPTLIPELRSAVLVDGVWTAALYEISGLARRMGLVPSDAFYPSSFADVVGLQVPMCPICETPISECRKEIDYGYEIYCDPAKHKAYYDALERMGRAQLALGLEPVMDLGVGGSS